MKSKIEEVHVENWCEEVEGKSSLRWYRTAKEEFEAERYIDSSLGQEAVRCIGFGYEQDQQDCLRTRRGAG